MILLKKKNTREKFNDARSLNASPLSLPEKERERERAGGIERLSHGLEEQEEAEGLEERGGEQKESLKEKVRFTSRSAWKIVLGSSNPKTSKRSC